MVLPCVSWIKASFVLRVLATKYDTYAFPDERELANKRDVLKLTMAVDGKAPTAEDTLERPMARVEKFQPVWELRVDM